MDILDKFIEEAKKSVQNGYYNIEEFKCEKNSLKNKLESQDFTLICEIKHASPAGEYSFDDIDVEKASKDFKECGADAISVVVEPKIFKGNLRNIPIVKKVGLPVLFKDFIFSEEQIKAAKNVGADVVLLIVKVFKRLNLDLDSFIEIAHKNGLEVLLESYDEEEMRIAMNSKADVLGINNRDLGTLKVDINRTKEILDSVGKLNKSLISESGIKSREDVEFVKKIGAKGVLVGTAIWKAEDLRDKIKELKDD